MTEALDVALLWHRAGAFYNVRLNFGAGTLSASINRLRKRIYHAKVRWWWHVVLTYDHESLEKEKKGEINSRVLSYFFKKVRKVSPEVKYAWKYEEGEKKGRPHFHLLFEVVWNFSDCARALKTDESKLRKKVAYEKGFAQNKDRANLELAVSLMLKELWGKGLVYAVFIKNRYQLENFVESDICKSTTKKFLKEKSRMYGFSKGIKYRKDDPSEYDFIGRVSKKEAFSKLKETKDGFVEYFSRVRNLNGFMLWEKTVQELMEGVYTEKKLSSYYKKKKPKKRMIRFMKFVAAVREIFQDNEFKGLEKDSVIQILSLEFKEIYVRQKLKDLIEMGELRKRGNMMLVSERLERLENLKMQKRESP